MVTWTALMLLVLLGLLAGSLGSVIGIGGGVVIVPALVLGFGYDIRVAVATSLVAVIGTSTAAGAVYVADGLANMRLGMSLEVATTLGGLTGGVVAVALAPTVISVIFAVVLAATAVLMLRPAPASPSASTAGVEGQDHDRALAPGEPAAAGAVGGWEAQGRLAGAYVETTTGQLVEYRATRVGLGSAIAGVAGLVSGMLGVGGGFLKVPAMTLGMQVPMRVATATSNFMIGVTAVASLTVYLHRGYVHLLIAVPVTLGVIVGAMAGTRAAARLAPEVITKVLAVVLVVVAAQMALDAAGIGAA